MKRYWQFLIIGILSLAAALLWARPRVPAAVPGAVVVGATMALQATRTPSENAVAKPSPAAGEPQKHPDDEPLPGSSSSLPLLAVIGFGVLAGGITSAMRTH